jgi:hypothetical protein
MLRGFRSLAIGVTSLATIATAAALCRTEPEPLAQTKLEPPAKPRFWKGNLHTHTLWSDGDDFPEMVADWYKRHDYHFLALSDHNVLSEGERWIDAGGAGTVRAKATDKYVTRFGQRWVERRPAGGKEQVRLKPLREFRSLLEESGRFLFIPAEEITHRFAKAPVHINAINLRDVIQPTDGDSIAETMRVNLRAVAAQEKSTGWRMIAFLNHPNFGWGVRAEDMILTDELRFFEVFNGHPSVRNYGDATHPSCERLWDIVLALRLGKHRLPIVYGLATDDAHGYHAFGIGKVNPGRGWVMARAYHLSAESIVRALDAGDFYSSTGVVLDEVARTGDEIRVDIRAEAGVQYRTQFIATPRDAALDSKPQTDKDGKPLPVTRVYGPEVGKVVAEVKGTAPRYRLTGKELYVRAKVLSTKPHPNPYEKGDVEVAWTQPFVP